MPLKNALASSLPRNQNRMAPKTSRAASHRSDPDAPVMPTDGEADCNRCGNKRYILDAEDKLVPCPQCNVVQKWRVAALEQYSSLQGPALSKTFFNFKTTFEGKENALLRVCLKAAEDFAAAPENRWLVIWGDRGNGKSHLCAAIANDLRHKNMPVLFVTVPDMFASLVQAREVEASTEQETFSGRKKLFKTAPVLILDDLGAETARDWTEAVLFEVLDYRYRNKLPTVIVTNLPLAELTSDELDPRIVSRMQDTSLCTVIENRTQDFRLRPVSQKE